MTERLRQALIRAGLTLLLSLGLTLTLAGVLSLPASAWVTGGVCAAVLSLLLGASTLLPRGGGWIGAGAALALGGLYLLAGGADRAGEVLQALALRLRGTGGALAYVSAPAALLIAFPVTLLCFAFTGEKMGPFAVLAVMLGLAALWLGERGDLIPLLIPSGGAALTVLARERAGNAPVRRSLPVLLAVTALAALIVPARGVTLPPLKEAADSLRQTIMDYFFFTEPRNVFTLASEGYYPQSTQDAEQLGGPASPSDHAVMTVETPRTAYLRGAVLNEYNGRAWKDTTGGRRYLWVSNRWREERAAAFDERLPAGTALPAVALRVTMEDGSASSLFVPQRTRALSVGGSLVPYFNIGSELFATRDLEAGDAYTVTAALQTAGDEGLPALLDACARQAGGQDSASGPYTALPEHLAQIEPWVIELAREITAGADSPYAAALAVRDWLKAHGRYRLDVPEHNPNYDFVATFLRPTREGLPAEGYCTYFASAMAVLCRAAGLPARYVEGYVARPGADGIARVTGLDAHAWVEVRLPGYGWLTFDPTPSAEESGGAAPPSGSPPPAAGSEPEPTPTPPPESPEAGTPPPTPTPTPEDEPPATPPPDDPTPPEAEPDADDAPDPPSDGWKILPVILGILLLIALILLRLRQTSPAQCARRAPDEAGRWNAWTRAVCDALAALGERRPPDRTFAQWFGDLDARNLSPVPLRPLGETAGVIFYSAAEPLAEETEAARETFAALFAGMTRRKRARFRAMRFFGRGAAKPGA